MDIERFDAVTSTFAERSTRRDALRGLAAVALGWAAWPSLAVTKSPPGRGGKKKGSRRRAGGSGGSSGGSASGSRSDRCGGPVGICNADPTPCGTTAEGKICGCERAVEGNNVCVNSGADNVCGARVECTSTDGPEATSCRSQVGFHFFCQEAKRSGNSSVAVDSARQPDESAFQSATTRLRSKPLLRTHRSPAEILARRQDLGLCVPAPRRSHSLPNCFGKMLE